MQLKVVACLLVLLLAPLVADGRPPSPPPPPPRTTKPTPLEGPVLDLAASSPDKYAAFMAGIQRVLIPTTGNPPPIKNNRGPVLGVQRRNAPCMYVILRNGAVQSATIAVRTDNLYLVGFKTQGQGGGGGSWYAFRGAEHYVPGSVPLSFESDYTSLTGERGYKNLPHYLLGKKAAQEALATLATYSTATSEKELKTALTGLVVMLCEAARFVPVRAAVKAAWDDGGNLPEACVELVVLWRDTSCALLVWSRAPTKKWDTIEEVKSKGIKMKGDPLMKTVDAALDNIYVLLRPSDICSDGKTAADTESVRN